MYTEYLQSGYTPVLETKSVRETHRYGNSSSKLLKKEYLQMKLFIMQISPELHEQYDLWFTFANEWHYCSGQWLIHKDVNYQTESRFY